MAPDCSSMHIYIYIYIYNMTVHEHELEANTVCLLQICVLINACIRTISPYTCFIHNMSSRHSMSVADMRIHTYDVM